MKRDWTHLPYFYINLSSLHQIPTYQNLPLPNFRMYITQPHKRLHKSEFERSSLTPHFDMLMFEGLGSEALELACCSLESSYWEGNSKNRILGSTFISLMPWEFILVLWRTTLFDNKKCASQPKFIHSLHLATLSMFTTNWYSLRSLFIQKLSLSISSFNYCFF